jgi:ubiquinone biosynthesis protein UbiJ
MTSYGPLLAFAEDIANRVLRLDPETLTQLGDLEGKVICLEVTAPPASVYLLPSAGGFRVRDTHEGKVDVVLRATLPAFLKLTIDGADGPGALAGIEIAGNLDVAQRFQRILQKIDIDTEELAARVVGDVAAHRLGNIARAGRRWFTEARRSLARDLVEYLQEERRVLPAKTEADAFFRAVDTLRGDVDRLEQRLRRLERT